MHSYVEKVNKLD
jgi:hypothetical protein